MTTIKNKDLLKDYIIISLIKTLAENYSFNYNIDKNIIEEHMLKKLEKFKIIDHQTLDSSIILFKNTLTQSLSEIIPNHYLTQNISLFKVNNAMIIGKGGFSNIYKVYNPLDDMYYALKKIGISIKSKQWITEVRAMAKLNHPNIVRYHMSWLESIDMENIEQVNTLLLNNYSSKSDLYSFGVTILDILIKFSTEMEKMILIDDMRNGNYEKLNKLVQDQNLNYIIKNLILENPSSRIFIDDILDHL
jgi:hypothetical protein